MNKKLKEAKAKLMLEHPYFGALSSELEFKESSLIETFETKDGVYHYNSKYIEKLSVDEIAFTLANCAMHKLLNHTQRGKKRFKTLWQMASDYAINSILVLNAMTLPDKVYFNPKYEGMYAEEIYETLLSEMEDSEINEQTNSEEILHDEESVDREYLQMVEMITKKFMDEGQLPNALERVVDIGFRTKVDWREELYRYVQTHAKIDYRLFPPNKKYLYLGYALPSVFGEMLNIAVAIDTSASIDKALLNQFLSELYTIMQLFPNYEIELIECDSKIRHISTLLPEEPLKSTIKGGGGTDFREVFSYLEGSDKKFLIYFSDGEGIYPDNTPTIDTLWVMPKAKEVPFGEVVEIG